MTNAIPPSNSDITNPYHHSAISRPSRSSRNTDRLRRSATQDAFQQWLLVRQLGEAVNPSNRRASISSRISSLVQQEHLPPIPPSHPPTAQASCRSSSSTSFSTRRHGCTAASRLSLASLLQDALDISHGVTLGQDENSNNHSNIQHNNNSNNNIGKGV